MASLEHIDGKYYARISIWNSAIKKVKPKRVPLRTDVKGTALQRLKKVQKTEPDIKSGIIDNINEYFPWLNCAGKSRIVGYTLEKAISEYLIYLKNNGAKKTTIERASYCLQNLLTVLGRDFCIETISPASIETFKSYYINKLTDNGININLTRIRAFINWCADVKEIIPKKPKVTFIKVPKKHPSYLTEENLKYIIKSDGISSHNKKVYKMYWETGMRLREPFKGRVEGERLIIEPEDSKTGILREIHLQPHHIDTIQEMQKRLKDSSKTFMNFSGYYSKLFKKVMRKMGRPHLHFHNLRDTFAIMRYLETRDIYQVSKELGHSTVKVTEKYTTFNTRKLEEDFPSLAKNYIDREPRRFSILPVSIIPVEENNIPFVEGTMA